VTTLGELAAGLDAEAAVRLLIDRQAIIERVTTCVTHGDLHEFDALAACYTDEIRVDYTSTLGGEPVRVAKAPIMAFWNSLTLQFDGMSHAVTNVQVDQDESTARTRSYVRAVHWIGDRVWTSGGIYHHELEKQADGRWLINGQRHTQRWEEGDRSLFLEAVAGAGPNPAHHS
jgi:hypothetical protein